MIGLSLYNNILTVGTECIFVYLMFYPGVGCSRNEADNWIAHQDDFNSLLANLNQNHGNTDTGSHDNKVLSLEQTSKTSRGRLHYQKFTKGKDLSLKSETDLHCVFGKRKTLTGDNTPQSLSEVCTCKKLT